MAYGIRHLIFFPDNAESRNAGTAGMLVKKNFQMLSLSVNPNTAFAVEAVMCLETRTA